MCISQRPLMTADASENARMCDGRRFRLDITVFSFHGGRTHRRQCQIDGMHAEASIAHLKQEVQIALGGAPDELELLVGSAEVRDSSSLSECGIRSSQDSRKVRALAHFELLLATPQPATGADAHCRPSSREDPAKDGGSGGSQGGDCRIAAPCVDGPAPAATDFDAAERQSLPERFQELPDLDIQPDAEKARHRVPPLLLQRRKRSDSPPEERFAKRRPNVTTDAEQASPEDTSSFGLVLRLSVFLGQHGHRRCFSVPVSKDTPIREIEDRLLEWLGTPPSELMLNFEGTALERERALSDYRIGSPATIDAMAWYEHARNSDLCLARGTAEQARSPSDEVKQSGADDF